MRTPFALRFPATFHLRTQVDLVQQAAQSWIDDFLAVGSDDIGNINAMAQRQRAGEQADADFFQAVQKVTGPFLHAAAGGAGGWVISPLYGQQGIDHGDGARRRSPGRFRGALGNKILKRPVGRAGLAGFTGFGGLLGLGWAFDFHGGRGILSPSV